MKRIRKRMAAFALAVCMMLTCVPLAVWATVGDEDTTPDLIQDMPTGTSGEPREQRVDRTPMPLASTITSFNQNDDRWENHPYGYSDAAGTQKTTIGPAGCGILSYVNAVYYLNGNFIDPCFLADWSVSHGHRVNGDGTAYSLYKAFADSQGANYGIKYLGYTSSYDTLKNYIQNGNVAIIHVPGHIMACVDYDSSNGKYLILDSYPSKNRGTSGTGYVWKTSSEMNSMGVAASFYIIGSTGGCSCSDSYAGWYTVVTESQPLNIWDSHGRTNSRGQIPRGATVYVSKGNGSWAHVEYNGVTGYSDMTYLSKQKTNNPYGMVDSCWGGVDTVNVGGWAIDNDDVSRSLEIHVYIGSTCIGTTVANVYRPDVNKVYQAGDYHGYEASFRVSGFTGAQTVDIYAINIGSGDNVLLGSYPVEISHDGEKPVISNVQISNIDTTGYTVSCTATDNIGIDRVAFAVWTELNGQDDLIWCEGTKNGDTWSIRVETSAHKNECGAYSTHVYAYDIAGNEKGFSLSNVIVPCAHAFDNAGVVTKNPTCGEAGVKTYTCRVCGATRTETVAKTTTHSYNSGVVTKQPTETQTGIRTFTCTVCGATKTETIPVLAHTHKYTTSVVAPTCTEKGYTAYTCTCGKGYTDNETAALGHKYNSGVVTTQPTASQPGVKTFTCTVCRTTRTESIPALPSEDALYFEVPAMQAAPGSELRVPVTLKNNPSALAALRVEIRYDETILILKAVENGTTFGDKPTVSEKLRSGCMVQWDTLDNTETDAVLMTLVFEVRDTEQDSTTVEMKPSQSFTIDEKALSIQACSFDISIQSYLIGDATGDGVVDTRDVLRVRKYLAGWEGIELIEAAADVTADGTVDLRDVLRLRKYLAGWDVVLG